MALCRIVSSMYSLKKFKDCKDLPVRFVCNVNEPAISPKKELEKVYRFFSVFGDRTSLSFNIYRMEFDMNFLIDYISQYGLNRHIRLGLAHPIPGEKNLYISPDKFKEVASKLMGFFEKFDRLAIEPGFDCGFPLCMFDDEQLGKVFKYTTGRVSFQCGPAIDIGTDLSVWSCFPLSSFNKKSLFDFQNYQELEQFYFQKMVEARQNSRGIYSECFICKSFEKGLCSGGCIAHILNKLNYAR